MQNHNGKYVFQTLQLSTDTGTVGVIDTVGDVAVADVRDMDNITLTFNQLTDNGTVTLIADYSIDGTNWLQALATKAETDFPAANNVGIVAYTFSDSDGMPLVAMQIRVRCTVHTGTGTYSAVVAGRQTAAYR
jgi:hypothetical protein